MSTMSEIALEQWERNVDKDYEESDPPVEEMEEDLSSVLESLKSLAEELPDSSSEKEALPAEKAVSDAEPSDDGSKEDAEAKARREKEAAELARIAALPDEEAMAASVKLAGEQVERLTRRNMKLAVTNAIQEQCGKDPQFARLVLSPRKNMTKCFRYINRKALDFLKEEQKAVDEPNPGSGIGGDVPDDLCYQWAMEYFRDPDALEDKDPAHTVSHSSKSKSGKQQKKPEKKQKVQRVQEIPKEAPDQMTFGGMEAA